MGNNNIIRLSRELDETISRHTHGHAVKAEWYDEKTKTYHVEYHDEPEWVCHVHLKYGELQLGKGR